MPITPGSTAKRKIRLRQEARRTPVAPPDDTVDQELQRDGEDHVEAGPATAVSAAFGLLARPGAAPQSIEALNEAISAGWAGETPPSGKR